MDTETVESPSNCLTAADIHFITPIQVEIETMQTHLTDHDYIDTTKPRPKKKKKQVKITELKAIYNCTTCGYKTMNRDVLYKHICTKNPKYILHRNTTKKLPVGYERCPKCNFSTKNLTNLRLHMGTHIEGVQQKCMDCDISKNCVDKVYKCPKCYYSSKNPTSLKVHMHIHSRGTPYKCTECNFSAKDLKELIRHYDQTKDLKCKCGYATHVRHQMRTHLRSHTGEKPYNCGICKYGAKDRAGLQRHMKKHSRD